MTYDFVMNLLLTAIYATLIALLVYKFTWKPLSITVEQFPTFVRLTYQHGWKTRRAQVAVSERAHTPTISKNFTHFTFVLPMTMSYGDAMRWLEKVEISDMYADHGRDAIELLRAIALYYYTRDLEQFKQFAPRCNHMRVLKAIRKNRHMLRTLLNNVAKPDMLGVPTKASLVRR